ncbi:UNVERIFIED_CONTAM: hypothetical protein NY100_26690, partial [Prevotella sp. 15_C9]
SRRLTHRTDGKGREFLVPAHHPYGRGESDGRENLPRVIRGEHVFTQRLGYGIPVLLDIDGRLSPGDENLCHETFF